MTVHQDQSAFVRDTGLSFLWLELTNTCNLECTHCYAGSSPRVRDEKPLSLAHYHDLLSGAYETGCRGVQFIGGEPTLNKHLPRLLSFAHDLGYEQIEVFTNLVALSDELLEHFVLLNVAVATSIYSSQKNVHDLITGRKGSWSRTERNLRRVIDARLDLRVAVITMEQNKDDYAATYDWLVDLGVENIGHDHVRAIGRADKNSSCEMGELCGQCAHGTLCVSPDGLVSPCIMSKSWPVGNAHESSIQAIASSDRLAKVRDQILKATEERALNRMGGCQPDSPNKCGPDSGDNCNPCNPKGHCGPNRCRPYP